MSRAGQLIRACHPEPTVAVTVVASALAISVGRGPGALWVAAAVLAGQCSIGWSNDVVDRRRDAAVGRSDKPIAAGRLPGRLVAGFAGAAAVAAIPLSFASGVPAGAVHVGAVASGWSYNLRLKSTVASVAPYAVSFGLLPSFVTLGLPGRPWAPGWLTAAGALLGAGAHFANAAPDLVDDARTGVRGLPHRLGPTGSRLAAVGLLLAATAALLVGPSHGDRSAAAYAGRLVAAVAAAGCLAVVALSRHGRAGFRAVLVLGAIDVALLVAVGAAAG